MVSTEDVTRLSTGGMIVGHQVMINGATVLLLERRHHQEAMQQLHLYGEVVWT